MTIRFLKSELIDIFDEEIEQLIELYVQARRGLEPVLITFSGVRWYGRYDEDTEEFVLTRK